MPPTNGGVTILGWALKFLIIALVAAVLGFGGIADVTIEVAKLAFVVAIILFSIAAVVGLVRRCTPTIPKHRVSSKLESRAAKRCRGLFYCRLYGRLGGKISRTLLYQQSLPASTARVV
jgi:uncharacterized membrane protein YtjA (UPF0391 family)